MFQAPCDPGLLLPSLLASHRLRREFLAGVRRGAPSPPSRGAVSLREGPAIRAPVPDQPHAASVAPGGFLMVVCLGLPVWR